ncbi:MAG: OadG family protein [Dehalococcoidales bacterium]|nr:OadG family protein [Dehalococcoidales bacterium]
MPLTEGLVVMVLGMGLVFLALTVLMFAMMGLEKAFRLKVAPEETAPEFPPTSGRQAEVVAAIACALARARAEVGREGPAGVTARGESRDWDWLWDESVDDYGLTRGSPYANV